MPKRTPEREKDAMAVAIGVVKKHLRLEPKDIMACHYRQFPPGTNDIIMKFANLGPDSSYEAILHEARKRKPKGIFAKILDAPCDSEVSVTLSF